MDYKLFIEHVKGVACVLSLTPGTNGAKDVIAIESANKAYLASVNKADEEFVPGRPYTYYIHADANFEANVHKAAETGVVQHNYVNAGLYKAWLDLYLLPLESDDPAKHYFLFTYDMSTHAKADKLLDVSEGTAMEVLRICIRLRETNDFQTAMNTVIKDIRKLCDSSGCSILLTDFKAKTCRILCADHDGSFFDPTDDIVFSQQFYSIAETWRDLMAGSNCYIIADARDMREAEKRDKVWVDSMRKSGVHNVVLYPLKVKDTILGYIWATNFNVKKTAFIKEVMELTAFFLSAEIANHRLFEKLDRLSRYDMLTGVLNRNAMTVRIDEWVAGKKVCEGDFGIVFVDLNGLKQTNDKAGHMAGDEMIRSVAIMINQVFSGYEIYRAGGDEFMVLAANCSKEDFTYLVNHLKDLAEDSEDAHFAIGSYYDDEDHDIRSAIMNADADMYRNKTEFYEKHPEMSRRK